MADEERDWKNFPPELLHIISQKLSDIRYFIRCRVVCKQWFSSILLSDPPRQQLPWLIECQMIKDPSLYGTRLRKELRFYSIADGETGTMPIHESHRRGQKNAFIRTGHSYMLLRSRIHHEISLLNPLTNKVISLPKIHPGFGVTWPVVCGEEHVLYLTDKNICYFATDHPDKKAFPYVVHNNRLSRTSHWMGKIFATEGGRSTLVFDVASRKMLYSIPPPKDEHRGHVNTYIVESCGVILRVSGRFRYEKYLDVEASSFHVYKLSFEAESEQPCWVKVSDIGNQIVFLDFYSGFSASAPAGLKGNCLYILLQYSDSTPCHYYTGNKLLRYDIGTGIAETVSCPLKRCMWFVPSLH